MKQSLSNALRGFVCGLAACALGALMIALMLALYDIPRTVILASAPWALMLLILALSCEAIAVRNGNLLLFILVCIALLFFGGEHVVRHTAFIPGSSGFPVLLRVLVWGSGFACAYAVHKLPASDLFVRLSDTLIISIAVYLGMLFLLGDALHMPILLLALCTLAACLITAASLRAGGESARVVRGSGMGGLLIMALLILICALLMVTLSSLFGGHVNSIVDLLLAIWRLITGIAGRALMLFTYFIALFAPKPVHYNMTLSADDSLPMSMAGVEISAKMPQWVIYLFIGFIILLAIAAIVGILWVLRRTKISRANRRTPRRVTRQNKMLAAILARIRAIREALAFEAAYKRHRRTPQGLYVLAVRACRLTKLRKRPSESPGVFIRRLHAHLLAKSGLSTLDALADKLDRALYANERVPLSHGESDAFAAQIQALRSLSSKKPAS